MQMKQTTRVQILNSTMKLAAKADYRHITREAIAEHAKVTPSLVSYHLGTMEQMRRHVMREAIRTENLAVLVQGLVAKDRHALKATAELKAAAVATLG